MEGNDAFDERGFGAGNILDRLALNGVRQEADEIAGVTRSQGHTDLALCLEPSDTRAMSGAGVDDYERPARIDGFHAFRRNDADQRVVPRPGQLAAVHHQRTLKAQDVWRDLACVFGILRRPLAKHIEKEWPPLSEVEPIFERILARSPNAVRCRVGQFDFHAGPFQVDLPQSFTPLQAIPASDPATEISVYLRIPR